MRSQKNVISLSQKPHQLCQIKFTRVESIKTELCFLLETSGRGKSLFGNVPWTGEREPWGTHWEPAAQAWCSLSSCSCQSCQKRGTHTSRRGWHWGENRWNWRLALWGKVWAQELHSALHWLSPTQSFCSWPLKTCSDCPGGMDQVERTLAGNTRKGHHSQSSQYKQDSGKSQTHTHLSCT